MFKKAINVISSQSFNNQQIIIENKFYLFDYKRCNGSYILSKSESVKSSLIESVICLFTDLSVQKYFSLTNQLIFTD